MKWNTYPGTVDTVERDRVPVQRWTPGSSGYARFVTPEVYVPPLRMAGWLRPEKHSSGQTPDDPRFTGLHVHVGHVGNTRNHVATLAREDGGHKLAVEYGWLGYGTHVADYDGGPELVLGRVYLFEVLWLPDRLTTTVSNEAGLWAQDAELAPERRIPAGHVGLRLDNLVVTGDLTIRAV